MVLFFIFLSLSCSYLVFVNRGNESMESIFLSMIYLLLVVHMLTALSVTYELNQTISTVIFVHTNPLLFLIGPAFYLYNVCLFNPTLKLNRSDSIHLIPMAIAFIAVLPYYILPWEYKYKLVHQIKSNHTFIRNIPLFNFDLGLLYILRPLITFYYMVKILVHHLKNWKILDDIYSPFKANLLKRWISLFTLLLLIADISNIIFQLLVYVHPKYVGFMLLPTISFLAMAILGIQLFFNPYIMYGFNQIRFNSNDSMIAKLYLMRYHQKYSEETIAEMSMKIDTYSLSYPYLKAGFTIDQMSAELDMSTTKLQYYFKHVYRDSFPNWKNRNRIEYAINLINDGYLKKFTMEELAKQCGFLSRSNFNEAMKKYTKN